MLTFLELYQTLLGFVFFKLYADAGLQYPPPLDTKKDESGAGVGAFNLEDATQKTVAEVPKAKAVEVGGKKISGKDVRQTIKTISTDPSAPGETAPANAEGEVQPETVDEDFVMQPSKSDANGAADLLTFQTLASLPQTTPSKLFAACTFWLSRETSRPIFEFIVRAFGGRIGWPATSGSGSPYNEEDDSITHVIIDRPPVVRPNETEEERARRLRRKYVQPQWAVDSVNAGRLLLEDLYTQGKTLPPHLSPFASYEGAYDPTAGAEDAAMADAESEVDDEEDAAPASGEEDEHAEDVRLEKAALAAAAAAAAVEDPADLRAAELAAEAAGVDFGAFEKAVAKSRRKADKAAAPPAEEPEENMNKMLMSNKQRKLYERMKHSQKKKATEVRMWLHVFTYVAEHDWHL